MSSVSRDTFTSSFLIRMPFFSCLIALARTSSNMLRRRGENGHPCFVPDLDRKNLQYFPIDCDVSVAFHVWPLLC